MARDFEAGNETRLRAQLVVAADADEIEMRNPRGDDAHAHRIRVRRWIGDVADRQGR